VLELAVAAMAMEVRDRVFRIRNVLVIYYTVNIVGPPERSTQWFLPAFDYDKLARCSA
jgi:hypothetical protein